MKNLKIKVVCLPDSEKEIEELLLNILADYCMRYSVLPVTTPVEVSVCLVEIDEKVGRSGYTFVTEGHKKILVQIRDIHLNDWQSNPYTLTGFLEVICHEFVHVCQYLTGRKGFKVPKLKYDKKDSREKYFFDPYEVEARALALFYVDKFTDDLI